jgi:hypothetical protein
MKNLTHCILALVPLVSAAGLTSAWTGQQERPQAEKVAPPQRARGEKQATLKKLVPTLKTSLAEGIVLAEKETTGKAFSAGIEIDRDGMASLQINLFVGEKVVIANVDPETKKVTHKEPAGADAPAGKPGEPGKPGKAGKKAGDGER